MISNELREDILDYYNTLHDTLPYVSGSSVFPCRRKFDCLPNDILSRLVTELTVTLSGYFVDFKVNPNNARIYESNYGTIKPHVDVAMYPGDTHTCLIYLTDDFEGGILTVKVKRDEEDMNTYGDIEKKHLCITPEPRETYGVLFQKGVIHYTDDLIGGCKIILLVDCQILPLDCAYNN